MDAHPIITDIPSLVENVPREYKTHVANMAKKMVTHRNYGVLYVYKFLYNSLTFH